MAGCDSTTTFPVFPQRNELLTCISEAEPAKPTAAVAFGGFVNAPPDGKLHRRPERLCSVTSINGPSEEDSMSSETELIVVIQSTSETQTACLMQVLPQGVIHSFLVAMTGQGRLWRIFAPRVGGPVGDCSLFINEDLPMKI